MPSTNESPAQPDCFVFACRVHGIFTSPCTDIPPPCCDHTVSYAPYSRFEPSRARQCLRSDNRYAFLALTPKTLPWESTLLGALKLINGTYLKRSRSGFWGLKKDIQDDWLLLEHRLHVLSYWLEAHIPLASLEAQSCPLPAIYGYTRLHESRDLAIQAIQNSLDAFMV